MFADIKIHTYSLLSSEALYRLEQGLFACGKRLP